MYMRCILPGKVYTRILRDGYSMYNVPLYGVPVLHLVYCSVHRVLQAYVGMY